jgi:hypothetical protein
VLRPKLWKKIEIGFSQNDPALILGFLAGKENETKNNSRYR